MSEFKKKEESINRVEVETTEEETNLFGREQIIINCQYCKKKILTETEHQTTWIGIGLSIIFFIIFNVFAIPLVLLLIPLTQQTNHSCPNCLNKVGQRTFYDVISLSDNVLTYKFGNFGIIITKKQVLAIFTFLLFGLIFYFFFSNINLERGNFIKEKWQDFKNECDHNKIENDCFKYMYSDVMWNGYVIRIDYIENFFARHRLNVLLKMEKNDLEEADIYLKFTDYQYEYFKNEIFNLTRGDYVSFNATFMTVGDVNTIPQLEVFGFEKLKDHIYIQPHIHHNSRYSVNHDEHINKNEAVYKEIPNLVSNDDIDIDQKETFH